MPYAESLIVDTGKAQPRDYIHGTIGFLALGGHGRVVEGPMSMLGPRGNP